MCKTIMTFIVISALSLGNVLAQTKTTSPEKQAKFKKQVVEWGTNKQVSVKLNSGAKVEGRVAEIQNDFFAVQSVSKEGQVSSQQVNFSDINKLSRKGEAGRIAGHTAVGILAGVGAVFVMLFVIYAANES